jgi:predicted Zn-dependent protease
MKLRPRIIAERRSLPAKRASAALWVVLTAATLAGCTSLGNGVGGPTAGVFTNNGRPAVQRGASDQEHARIVAAYGGIYQNDDVERAMIPIVSKVVTASERPGQSYQITILNADAVNAFALPGGRLYVTRGLLALANDSSEVAAVLAHEMAHITADHAVERQNKARNALIVSRVVNDVLDDDPDRRLALASSQRSLATFSQRQELEADAIGVKTIGQAGYDPFAAGRFLGAMGQYSQYRTALTMPAQQPEFLSSHPTTPQRIEFAERAARQFGAPGIGVTERERYLEGIDGMLFGDDPSQGFVRDRSFVHPKLGVGFTVPVGFVIDNASDAVLATGIDGTALRFDAVGLTRGTDLADYLRSGWVNGLDDSSITSFAVNGLKAASAQASAKGWFFQISVIQVRGGATYRFIFANEAVTPAFLLAAGQTADSFRKLSAREIAGLKALRIKVITVKRGDTIGKLAKRMRGVDLPQKLLLTLNRLEPGARLEPGTEIKIVTDR